jgi:flagellar secretion chaperone FliS
MFSTNLAPIEQYRHVGTVTDVATASPHQLVVLLFDGAIAAILQARHALETGDMDTKHTTISKAMRIIDEGLKASVESHGDASLGDNLRSLYEHMVSRLFLANLHNSDVPLAEVLKLLGDLRSTWAEIAPQPTPRTRPNLQA